MSDATRIAWPPLIVATEKPRWLWWRDFALTVAMWLLLAIMLETEFEFFIGRYLERIGFGNMPTDAHWREFFVLLKPFLMVVAALLTFLFASSIFTAQRRHRALRLAPPAVLDPATEAAIAGIDEAALLDARKLRSAVVHVAADGTRRIEPR